MDNSTPCTCQLSSLCVKHNSLPEDWMSRDYDKPLTQTMVAAIGCHQADEMECGQAMTGVHALACTEAYYEGLDRIDANAGRLR